MERTDARRVLGVAADATPEEVRAAYRRLVRTHHPDIAGAQHTRVTADITLAYRTLRGGAAPGEEPDDDTGVDAARATDGASPAVDEACDGRVVRVDDDSFAIALPPDEAFLRILDLGHRLGEVTYVDPDGGLLETIVQFDDGSTCSAVFTTQGRANGSTEVFCTLARLAPARATSPAPAARIVVDAAVDALSGDAPI
ncbi:MAG TPA: J domain-containing protein [Acidimicrobiales bacterium]|nr:J domain-containing protein [Acidimicrobiales bacterium]